MTDPYNQGILKLPQLRPEKPSSLNDSYIICLARGSSKFSQPVSVVANSKMAATLSV